MYNIMSIIIILFAETTCFIYIYKTDFELGVGGEGQDTSRHFEGSFGSIRAILPTEGSEQNLGQKPKSVLKGIELIYCQHSICLYRNEHLRKKNSKLDEK